MTQQKRHSRLPVLSAVCALAAYAFAAAAGDEGAITGARAESAVIQSGAAFNLTDYYHWRENVALPLRADDGTSAAGVASSAVRLSNHRHSRGDDNNFDVGEVFDLNGLAAGAINGGGNSIAQWRKQTQMKLFSTLEDELARRGEEALLLNFTDLRKSQIHLQTELGGRKGHVGAALVGSIAEAHNTALGWQLRAYGGQEDSKGINAGLFYRRINGETLLGGNLFADYEDHEAGRFIRYSIGGDVQHRFFSLAANYYVPITGEKRTQTGEFAFSRQGYDIRARVAIPQTRYVRAAMDYYSFEGGRREVEHQGIRYGAELFHFPLPGLRLGLFYDDDGEQLGSEFAYNHTFGEEPKRAPYTTETPPLDLFAPVDREHSQRIAVSPAPLALVVRPNSAFVVQPTTITLSGSGPGQLTTYAVTVPTLTPNTTMHFTVRQTLATLSADGGRHDYDWDLLRDEDPTRPEFFNMITLNPGSPPDNLRELSFAHSVAATFAATVIARDNYHASPQFSVIFSVTVQ